MSVSNNPEHTVQDFDHEMHYVTNQVKIPIDSVQLMPGAVVSKVYPESKRGLLRRLSTRSATPSRMAAASGACSWPRGMAGR